jgi:hypothetical protein
LHKEQEKQGAQATSLLVAADVMSQPVHECLLVQERKSKNSNPVEL